MAFDNLLFDRDDAVATLTINRPAVLNALNGSTLDDLAQAMQALRDDTAVRAVILTGAGTRAFAAGADIRELAGMTPASARELALRGQATFDLIESLGKPVVAAINGFAFGGGCELAMACTIRVAADSARLGQPEINLGLMPGYGGTQRLPRLVGKGVALHLILTGGMIGAQEAYRIGLVNEVVSGAELVGRAEAILKKIAANAPLSVKYALQAVNNGVETSLSEGLLLEASLVAICTSTEDKKEGTSAFLEKRPAKFQGR